jgi:hypothetical protein
MGIVDLITTGVLVLKSFKGEKNERDDRIYQST